MTDRETVVVTDGGSNTGVIGGVVTGHRVAAGTAPSSSVGAVLGLLLALIVLLGAWFFVFADASGRSIKVNDHTDDAVPMVDRQAHLPIGV